MSVNLNEIVNGTASPTNADMLGNVPTEKVFSDLDGKMSIELLWENASPNSEFAAQTVTLLGSYDFYRIVYYGANDDNANQIADCLYGKIRTIDCVLLGGMTAYVGYRTVSWDGNNMVFKDCVYTQNGITNSSSVRNGVCKPLYIYGIKGVSA